MLLSMKQFFHHLCINNFGMLTPCMYIAHTINIFFYFFQSLNVHIILNGDFTESSRLLSLLNTVSLDIRLDLLEEEKIK